VKLVFYGGGHETENFPLHRKSLQLTGKQSPTVAYIPAQSYGAEADFKEFIYCFKKLGVKKFLFCPVDRKISDVLKDEIFSSDLIHLGGGNTFYFLHSLRRGNLIRRLRQFAREGGVLTGLSAGGILMTPKITAAGYPPFDCDDNDENLADFNALKLVNFEFFPHYKNSQRYNNVLLKESKKLKYPLYACSDCSGLVYSDGDIEFFGKCYTFKKGERAKARS
jgi:dipeptidase E